MRITILEDEKQVSDKILLFLEKYGNENNIYLDVNVFADGYSLLRNYKGDADVLFLDIQLPDITGMEVAKRIRKIDQDVVIVFVTNLHQYAIDGYEVGAFDFILKPLNYMGFSLKLDRICKELSHKSKEEKIMLSTREGLKKLNVADIYYVEVVDHDAVFHLAGEEVRIRRPLSNIAAELAPFYFVLCNSCYLVNLRRIKEVKNNTVFVGDAQLPISKSKRKSFFEEMAKYIGGTV